MQSVLRALVAAVYVPPNSPVPNPPVATREALNRIWTEVTSTYPYQSLQFSPQGDAVQFIGSSPEEGVTIQPPLVQVQESVLGSLLSAETSARKAQAILKTVQEHLGVPFFLNLGIRVISNFTVPSNDGRDFILHRAAVQDEARLGELAGGGYVWMGLKYVVHQADGSFFTAVVEPLQADPRMLYVDLDAQFPGMVALDAIEERTRDSMRYVDRVLDYLKHSGTAG